MTITELAHTGLDVTFEQSHLRVCGGGFQTLVSQQLCRLPLTCLHQGIDFSVDVCFRARAQGPEGAKSHQSQPGSHAIPKKVWL
jgi:hypothetical protein